MRHVYANHLSFAGTPEETLPRARAVVRLLAARPFGGWPAHHDPSVDGSWRPNRDTTIRWRNLSVEGTGRLFSVVTDRPLERDPTMRWREATQVGASPEGAFAYSRLSLLATSSVLSGSVHYDLDAPEVCSALVDQLVVSDAGRRLAASPWPVQEAEAGALCTCLTHPRRRLPVIGVTATSGGDGLDPMPLARQLAGLAHTVRLGADAIDTMAEFLGPQAVPRNGEVRLWWPGWTVGDGIHRSDRWGIADLGGGGGPGAAITRRVFAVSAFRLPEPDLAGRLVAGAARARVSDLEERLQSDDAPASAELLEAWEADLVELESARTEAQEFSVELARTRAELADVLQRWNERSAAVERVVRNRLSESAVAGVPTSMAEAIERVARECPHLVVLSEARESADRSPFIRPAEVHRDLVVLDSLVADWREDRLPAGFAGPAIERGLDWVPDVSDTAKSQYRSDYERSYEGQTILLGPHLRFGDGPPDRHCRVYLYMDKERRRIVVGHAGRHLRDAGNR